MKLVQLVYIFWPIGIWQGVIASSVSHDILPNVNLPIHHFLDEYGMMEVAPSTCGLGYESFMIVTYDRNDSSLYFKIPLLANLALTRMINYDRKVRCRLKRTLRL